MPKDVLSQQAGYLKGVGETPAPTEIAPQAMLANPYTCARSWGSWTKELATLHFGRHHPDWAKNANDDAVNSIDVMLKLNTPNTHTLAGWGFDLTQLVCVCYTNGNTIFSRPIPQIGLVDRRGLSDSTWIMMSKKKKDPIASKRSSRTSQWKRSQEV
jgi:hypothetical protein